MEETENNMMALMVEAEMTTDIARLRDIVHTFGNLAISSMALVNTLSDTFKDEFKKEAKDE